MRRLFRQVILRSWRREPGQVILVLALLAVGVAVFLAVRLANQAALAGFDTFTEVLTGRRDWVISSTRGQLGPDDLERIRQRLPGAPLHLIPLIEKVVSPPPAPDQNPLVLEAYTLLGVDLFAAANLELVAGGGTPWRERTENTLWTTAATLAAQGDSLSLRLGDQVRRFDLRGPLPSPPNQPAPPARLLVADLIDVQEWLERGSGFDRLEVIIEPGPLGEALRPTLGAILQELGGESWRVETPGARQDTVEAMTRAFRLNLTLLSLLALLVGLFLIHQTFEGQVVRRRAEIATLRSLGVSSRVVQGLWLGEALVLGCLGSLGGLLLGWVGAQAAVQAVGRTMNALYVSSAAEQASLTWGEALLALGVGWLVCLGAAWGPARQAAQTPPAQLLSLARTGGALPAPPRLWPGLLLLALAFGLAQLPPLAWSGGTPFPLAGHAASFLTLFGASALAGFALVHGARIALALGLRSAPHRVAWSYLRHATRRHRLALGGLICATAMTGGMLILVASFEKSVRAWIEQALRADLYVSNGYSPWQSRLSAETIAALSTSPGVREAWPHYARRVFWQGQRTQLHGAPFAELQQAEAMLWLERPRPSKTTHPAAWASEAFLHRFSAKVGEVVTLPTAQGSQPVELVASFSDYGNDQGALWLALADYRAAWPEDDVSSLALRLAPGHDPEKVRLAWLQERPGLTVLAQTTLRAEILRIFRQTFSLTYALEAIGVLVAVAGLALTLVSIGLERRTDLTTLRALGFSRRDLTRQWRTEAFGLALVSTVLGLAVAVALGALLVYVINRQSFGWTLQFGWPLGSLALLALGLLLTALGVGHAVGRWGSQLPADREENA